MAFHNFYEVDLILVHPINGSVLQAKNWIKELRRIVGDDIAVYIVGNKVDLEKNRTVSIREAERYYEWDIIYPAVMFTS